MWAKFNAGCILACALLWLRCSERYPLISPDDASLRQPLEVIEASPSPYHLSDTKTRIIADSKNPKILLNWVSTTMSDPWKNNAILEMQSGTTTLFPVTYKVAIYTLPREEYLLRLPVNQGRSMVGFALIKLLNDTDNNNAINDLIPQPFNLDSINDYPYVRTLDKDWLFGASFQHYIVYCSDDTAVNYLTDTMFARARYVVAKGPDTEPSIRPGYNIVSVKRIQVIQDSDIFVTWQITPDTAIRMEIVESFKEYADSIETVKGMLPSWLLNLSTQ
jgi:hypothetical protein